MRYHYEKPEHYTAYYGMIYECNHPIYSVCTLYSQGSVGLAVIQQRFDAANKVTYWSDIDPWLVDQLYLAEGFSSYFNKYAKRRKDGLYPTVTIRQIMWGLKFKPLEREPWETYFDHAPI